MVKCKQAIVLTTCRAGVTGFVFDTDGMSLECAVYVDDDGVPLYTDDSGEFYRILLPRETPYVLVVNELW